MSNYDLNDNVQESFTFNFKDKKYSMRYPRTEEVEGIQDINDRLEQARADKDEPEVKRINKELEEFLYKFITPVDHDVPVKDALRKENIKVLQNFNKMIKQELAIQ